MRACVRASVCVRACVRARARARVCVCVCVCVWCVLQVGHWSEADGLTSDIDDLFPDSKGDIVLRAVVVVVRMSLPRA